MAKWQKDGLLSPTILGGKPGAWDGMKEDQYLMRDDGPWFYSILGNEEGSKFNPDEETVSGSWWKPFFIEGENLVTFAGSEHP
jgi:multiple sugar transport system substrate-binding protein